MNIVIDKNNIKPASWQLRDALAEAIRKGELTVGGKIPSENALGRKCGIHRHTARNSLQLLADEGLVTSVPGRGWFVAGAPDMAPDASGYDEIGLPEIVSQKVVGIVYGAPPNTISSSFTVSFLNNLLEVGKNRGYDVRFLSDEDVHDMKIQGYCLAKPDIIIWVMPPPDSIRDIEQLTAAGFKVVVANRQLYGTGLPFVAVNQYSGARELVSRLVNAGHRRIGCVTSDRPYRYVSERWRGFSDAMHAAGLEPDEKLILHVVDSSDIRKGLKKLFEANPDMTALFLAGETFHRQTFEYIRDTGRKIPEDISVAAFDTVEFNGLKGKIAAAEQPAEQMSEQLFAVAARLLSDNETRDSETGIVIEPAIRPGESIRRIQ